MIVIPEAITFSEFYLLIGTSFFTSFLTTAIGIGGGTLLLAVLAQVLPVKAIIPVHGVVQLGSNVGRATVMYQDIDYKLASIFIVGCIIGTVIGGQIVINLPVEILRFILGLFILYSVWGPKPSGILNTPIGLSIGGLLTSVAGMFVGATGPLVVAILKSFPLSKQGIVATMSVCLAVQHSLKWIVFGLLGFAFADYLWLIVLMIVAGFMGTLIGKRLLLKLKNEHFVYGLHFVLTVLALRLIWQALSNWF